MGDKKYINAVKRGYTYSYCITVCITVCGASQIWTIN